MPESCEKPDNQGDETGEDYISDNGARADAGKTDSEVWRRSYGKGRSGL